MGYKGHWVRRRQVSHKTWCDNWERALGKKPEAEPEKTKCPDCGGKGDDNCSRCDGLGVIDQPESDCD